MSLPPRLRLASRGLSAGALALLAVLAVACGGGADAPGDGPPGPAANATQSTLLRPSADSPAAVPTRTATPEPATPEPATPEPVAPVVTRTAVPGCARGATAPPAIYYGFGLTEGEVVIAFNTRAGCEQIVCEQTEVDGDGFWVLRVAGDNVCGVREGDRVIFTVDGQRSDVSALWSAGDAPADAQRGIALREN